LRVHEVKDHRPESHVMPHGKSSLNCLSISSFNFQTPLMAM
jgi:hypothetical protein